MFRFAKSCAAGPCVHPFDENDVVSKLVDKAYVCASVCCLHTGSADLQLVPVRVELSQPHDAATTASSSGSNAQNTGAGAGTAATAATAAAAAAPTGRIIALAAAKFHSAVITEDGRLFTFGFGRGGRLGHADFHIHSGSSAQVSTCGFVNFALGPAGNTSRQCVGAAV